jgi:hypothetical protein
MLAGLGGMEAGFLALGGALSPSAVPALPMGGILVLAGATIAVASLARTLWRARPLPFSARFIAAGLAFLLAALAMGWFSVLPFPLPGGCRRRRPSRSGLVRIPMMSAGHPD